jgi:hypothetical protein
MRLIPDTISLDWIDSLSDPELLDVEARLKGRFALLERREKKLRGYRYQLCRGPADLMAAWDRWSRVSTATRDRSLRPL